MRTAPGRNSFSHPSSSADWGGRITRAEVNLDALAGNVRQIIRLAPQSSLMAVVKANGYGHGATAVAREALRSGATRLGVYTVDEGVSLRRDGITAPILVFGPFEPGEASSIWADRLTPTLTSRESAEILQGYENGPPLSYHVKVDTGLTRAGVDPADMLPLLRSLREFPGLRPEGLFTHFALADEPDKDFTHQQLRVFLETVNRLSEAGFDFPVKHAANSAAALNLPATHLDMIRAGICLYGYYPSASSSSAARLRPVMTVLSAVTRVQAHPAGTGVGYGHEFVASRDSVIALVPIGYGDGLSRKLGTGTGRVIIRESFAPIVGRVSMDQITIDVTDVPGVAVGDPVTILGAQGNVQQDADDVALQTGTISYDVLTGLLPRIPRLYAREGRIIGEMSYLSGPRYLDRAPVSAVSE